MDCCGGCDGCDSCNDLLAMLSREWSDGDFDLLLAQDAASRLIIAPGFADRDVFASSGDGSVPTSANVGDAYKLLLAQAAGLIAPGFADRDVFASSSDGFDLLLAQEAASRLMAPGFADVFANGDGSVTTSMNGDGPVSTRTRTPRVLNAACAQLKRPLVQLQAVHGQAAVPGPDSFSQAAFEPTQKHKRPLVQLVKGPDSVSRPAAANTAKADLAARTESLWNELAAMDGGDCGGGTATATWLDHHPVAAASSWRLIAANAELARFAGGSARDPLPNNASESVARWAKGEAPTNLDQQQQQQHACPSRNPKLSPSIGRAQTPDVTPRLTSKRKRATAPSAPEFACGALGEYSSQHHHAMGMQFAAQTRLRRSFPAASLTPSNPSLVASSSSSSSSSSLPSSSSYPSSSSSPFLFNGSANGTTHLLR
ncbi:hypothetical protein CLOM_g15376 [Closterium sp. NIES-68]|nr:hypothetical protein CLOM_g15376 [Closterium sp. NIES-68]